MLLIFRVSQKGFPTIDDKTNEIANPTENSKLSGTQMPLVEVLWHDGNKKDNFISKRRNEILRDENCGNR
jgi:hypothetical protein